MELDTKDNGRKTCSMVKEKKRGLMALSMKGSIISGRSMGEAHTIGMMDQCMTETGRRTKLRDWGHTNGWMEDSIRELGLTTIWMVLVSTNGQTEDRMKESILMTRSMDLEYTLGLTLDSILAGGSEESSTDWGLIMSLSKI